MKSRPSVPHEANLCFDARSHISRAAEVRVVKFCMQVEYIKGQPWDDRLSPNGRGWRQVTRLKKISPNHIFEIGETRHFKCRMLIDTEVY